MKLTARLAALGAVLASPLFNCAAQQPASDQGFHAAHNALFAAFLPVEDLPGDPTTTAMLTAARDGIWKEAGSAPSFDELLAPFTDLRAFGPACGFAKAIDGTNVTAFADPAKPKRDQVLYLLQTCSANQPSRLAATVRNFYIVKGYGAIQAPLTGVDLNLFATPEYLQATDKMGSTEQNSVVGQDFHVWGTKNLYVVDGSIFRTSVGANPMQSIYTIAKIFYRPLEHCDGSRGSGER